MGWRRRHGSSAPCNDTERLLRSGRGETGAPVLWPGVGERKVAEALGSAHLRLGDAQRLLAPFRDGEPDAPELAQAYLTVHAARVDIAAARHWSALCDVVAEREAQRTDPLT